MLKSGVDGLIDNIEPSGDGSRAALDGTTSCPSSSSEKKGTVRNNAFPTFDLTQVLNGDPETINDMRYVLLEELKRRNHERNNSRKHQIDR